MHRAKGKPLKEQFTTLDDPTPEVPAPELVAPDLLQLVDEPERPPGWPAGQKEKRSMPITISFVFLAMACLCFVLAAFNAPVSPRVNMIGLGLFFWTLSLVVRSATP